MNALRGMIRNSIRTRARAELARWGGRAVNHKASEDELATWSDLVR